VAICSETRIIAAALAVAEPGPHRASLAFALAELLLPLAEGDEEGEQPEQAEQAEQEASEAAGRGASAFTELPPEIAELLPEGSGARLALGSALAERAAHLAGLVDALDAVRPQLLARWRRPARPWSEAFLVELGSPGAPLAGATCERQG